MNAERRTENRSCRIVLLGLWLMGYCRRKGQVPPGQIPAPSETVKSIRASAGISPNQGGRTWRLPQRCHCVVVARVPTVITLGLSLCLLLVQPGKPLHAVSLHTPGSPYLCSGGHAICISIGDHLLSREFALLKLAGDNARPIPRYRDPAPLLLLHL